MVGVSGVEALAASLFSKPEEWTGGWVATLSDGRTAYQHEVESELSAWRRLLGLLEATTALGVDRLWVERGGRRYEAPRGAELYCHYESLEVVGGQQVHRQAVGGVFGDREVLVWVDDDGNCTVEIRVRR